MSIPADRTRWAERSTRTGGGRHRRATASYPGVVLTLHAPSLSAPGARLLAVGAHPDDIEIGAGGTVLTLLGAAPRTVHVTWVVLSGTPERAAEAAAAAQAFCGDAAGVDLRVLDLPDGRFPAHWDAVKQALEDLREEIDPTLILGPRPGDAHQDHRTVAELLPTSFRAHAVWGYEIPKFDGDTVPLDTYVPLTAAVLDRKIELLHDCFVTQRDKPWFSGEVFRALPSLRGVECRAPYAEAFHSGRTVVGLDPDGDPDGG